jgi:hypothetical protein
LADGTVLNAIISCELLVIRKIKRRLIGGGRKKNINDGCKNNAGGLKNEVDKNNPGKQGAQFYW